MTTNNEITFSDHIVAHPYRYKRVPVPGTTDLFDMIPTWVDNPNEIVQLGTAVDRQLFEKLRGNVTRRSQVYTATANQTVFNLANAYLVDQGRLDVYISGVKQRTGLDFEETNPTRFTLSEGLDAGTIVEAVYFSASQALSEDLIEQVQAAEAATSAAVSAAEEARSAALNWKEPVNNFAALASLPTPQIRDTRMARDTGKVYRFDGAAWVEIQDIDPTAINALDTRLTSQLADKAKEIKEVKQTYESTSATFCFIDDDIRAGVYTKLRPLFNAKGIKLTSAAITTWFGNPSYMTTAQILEMHNEGHEFISHTRTHRNLTEVPDNELESELLGSKQDLAAIGIHTDHIAYPFGGHDARVLREVQKYYKSGARSVAGLNTRPIPTYAIRRIGVGSWGYTEWAPIKKFIDDSIAQKLLCVIMLHVDDTPAEFFPLIEQTIDYIQSLNQEILTYGQAWEKHKNYLEHGEFDFDIQKPRFAVSHDGMIGSNDHRVITTKADAFTATSVPSDFKIYHITNTFIYNSNAAGFPFNKGGHLATYRLVDDQNVTFQVYRLHDTNRTYTRRWNWSAWTRWVEQDGLHVTETDRYTNATLLSSFDYGLTVTPILDAAASGFPRNKGGTLTTYKMTGDDLLSYQEFKPRDENNKYTRRWNSVSSVWTAWRPENGVIVDRSAQAPTLNSVFNDFVTQTITYTVIGNAQATNAPTPNIGGTLITFNVGDSFEFCYQEYHPVGQSTVYKRAANNNTAWKAWAQV